MAKRKSYKDEAKFWKRKHDELLEQQKAGVVSPASPKEDEPKPSDDDDDEEIEVEDD